MTEERKKEILKTIEERISSIPEEYVSKVIADWFFCSGEEDLMEVAKSIKGKDSDLSQHMRDWYVKTRGCTKTEMALVLTDPEFMLTSSLKDKILSQNSIRLMQNDNFKIKVSMIVLEKVCSDTHRGSILGWPAENFAWVENI